LTGLATVYFPLWRIRFIHMHTVTLWSPPLLPMITYL